MRIWFECKVKYYKENDQGLLKSVSETYLMDSLSFTEAEATVYQRLEEAVPGDFQVTSIKNSNIFDVCLFADTDLWHKCKVTFIVADADSGKEKVVNQFYLVTANTVNEAYERLMLILSNILVSIRITSVVETKIMEVFRYEKEDYVYHQKEEEL